MSSMMATDARAMDEELKAAIEAARTDPTIPTTFPASEGCIDCENHGHCVCWNWRDEAEFRHETSKLMLEIDLLP